MNFMPMCHKCADGLFALNPDCKFKSQTFKGCKANSRITTFADAQLYCPILPKAIEVEVEAKIVTAKPAKPVTLKGRKLPQEWCDIFGVQVVDPDGWRHGHKPDWNTPITRDMFIERYNMSTVRVVNKEVYANWKHIFG